METNSPLHAQPGWTARIGRSNSTRLLQLALQHAGLSLLLTALLLVGCASAPSRFYTTRENGLSYSANDPDPPLCDTFLLGEHPLVVVEGFEGIKEVILEVSSDGKLLSRHSFPLGSGQVNDTLEASAAVYPSPWGVQGQARVMSYNLGDKIDLGMPPCGVYDLALKTNNLLAALAHFKVVMPAKLENERQALELARTKLEEAQGAVKQLRSEIEQRASVLDRSNAVLVSDFNHKAEHYNELLKRTKADEEMFNEKVKAYNDLLLNYGIKAAK